MSAIPGVSTAVRGLSALSSAISGAFSNLISPTRNMWGNLKTTFRKKSHTPTRQLLETRDAFHGLQPRYNPFIDLLSRYLQARPPAAAAGAAPVAWPEAAQQARQALVNEHQQLQPEFVRTRASLLQLLNHINGNRDQYGYTDAEVARLQEIYNAFEGQCLPTDNFVDVLNDGISPEEVQQLQQNFIDALELTQSFAEGRWQACKRVARNVTAETVSFRAEYRSDLVRNKRLAEGLRKNLEGSLYTGNPEAAMCIIKELLRAIVTLENKIIAARNASFDMTRFKPVLDLKAQLRTYIMTARGDLPGALTEDRAALLTDALTRDRTALLFLLQNAQTFLTSWSRGGLFQRLVSTPLRQEPDIEITQALDRVRAFISAPADRVGPTAAHLLAALLRISGLSGADPTWLPARFANRELFDQAVADLTAVAYAARGTATQAQITAARSSVARVRDVVLDPEAYNQSGWVRNPHGTSSSSRNPDNWHPMERLMGSAPDVTTQMAVAAHAFNRLQRARRNPAAFEGGAAILQLATECATTMTHLHVSLAATLQMTPAQRSMIFDLATQLQTATVAALRPDSTGALAQLLVRVETEFATELERWRGVPLPENAQPLRTMTEAAAAAQQLVAACSTHTSLTAAASAPLRENALRTWGTLSQELAWDLGNLDPTDARPLTAQLEAARGLLAGTWETDIHDRARLRTALLPLSQQLQTIVGRRMQRSAVQASSTEVHASVPVPPQFHALALNTQQLQETVQRGDESQILDATRRSWSLLSAIIDFASHPDVTGGHHLSLPAGDVESVRRCYNLPAPFVRRLFALRHNLGQAIENSANGSCNRGSPNFHFFDLDPRDPSRRTALPSPTTADLTSTQAALASWHTRHDTAVLAPRRAGHRVLTGRREEPLDDHVVLPPSLCQRWWTWYFASFAPEERRAVAQRMLPQVDRPANAPERQQETRMMRTAREDAASAIRALPDRPADEHMRQLALALGQQDHLNSEAQAAQSRGTGTPQGGLAGALPLAGAYSAAAVGWGAGLLWNLVVQPATPADAEENAMGLRFLADRGASLATQAAQRGIHNGVAGLLLTEQSPLPGSGVPGSPPIGRLGAEPPRGIGLLPAPAAEPAAGVRPLPALPPPPDARVPADAPAPADVGAALGMGAPRRIVIGHMLGGDIPRDGVGAGAGPIPAPGAPGALEAVPRALPGAEPGAVVPPTATSVAARLGAQLVQPLVEHVAMPIVNSIANQIGNTVGQQTGDAALGRDAGTVARIHGRQWVDTGRQSAVNSLNDLAAGRAPRAPGIPVPAAGGDGAAHAPVGRDDAVPVPASRAGAGPVAGDGAAHAPVAGDDAAPIPAARDGAVPGAGVLPTATNVAARLGARLMPAIADHVAMPIVNGIANQIGNTIGQQTGDAVLGRDAGTVARQHGRQWVNTGRQSAVDALNDLAAGRAPGAPGIPAPAAGRDGAAHAARVDAPAGAAGRDAPAAGAAGGGAAPAARVGAEPAPTVGGVGMRLAAHFVPAEILHALNKTKEFIDRVKTGGLSGGGQMLVQGAAGGVRTMLQNSLAGLDAERDAGKIESLQLLITALEGAERDGSMERVEGVLKRTLQHFNILEGEGVPGPSELGFAGTQDAIERELNFNVQRNNQDQPIEAMIEREKGLFVNNTSYFAPLKLISEVVCGLPKADLAFYADMIVAAQAEGPTTEYASLKKKFYAHLEREHVGWFKRWIIVPILLFVGVPLTHNVLKKGLDNFLGWSKEFIKQNNKDTSTKYGNRVVQRTSGYLGILQSAFGRVANNATITGPIDHEIQRELDIGAVNGDMSRKDLYDHVAAKAIDEFILPAKDVGWGSQIYLKTNSIQNFPGRWLCRAALSPVILVAEFLSALFQFPFKWTEGIEHGGVRWGCRGLLLIASPFTAMGTLIINPIADNLIKYFFDGSMVETMVSQSLNSMQVDGYSHALNNVIYDQLAEVYHILQKHYGVKTGEEERPRRSGEEEEPKIDLKNMSIVERESLRTLVQELFGVLPKSECHSPTELRHLLNGNPSLLAQPVDAVNNFIYGRVTEGAMELIGAAFQTILQKGKMERQLYNFMSMANGIYKRSTPIRPEEYKAKEEGITRLLDNILRLAIDGSLEESLDFDRTKETQAAKGYIDEMQKISSKLVEKLKETRRKLTDRAILEGGELPDTPEVSELLTDMLNTLERDALAKLDEMRTRLNTTTELPNSRAHLLRKSQELSDKLDALAKSILALLKPRVRGVLGRQIAQPVTKIQEGFTRLGEIFASSDVGTWGAESEEGKGLASNFRKLRRLVTDLSSQAALDSPCTKLTATLQTTEREATTALERERSMKALREQLKDHEATGCFSVWYNSLGRAVSGAHLQRQQAALAKLRTTVQQLSCTQTQKDTLLRQLADMSAEQANEEATQRVRRAKKEEWMHQLRVIEESLIEANRISRETIQRELQASRKALAALQELGSPTPSTASLGHLRVRLGELEQWIEGGNIKIPALSPSNFPCKNLVMEFGKKYVFKAIKGKVDHLMKLIRKPYIWRYGVFHHNLFLPFLGKSNSSST